MGKVQSQENKELEKTTSMKKPFVEGNPISLHDESLFLQGARNMLLKLKQDYDIAITPSVLCKCVAKSTGKESEDWFPLPRKYRTLFGKSFLSWLLQGDNIRKYLQGNTDSFRYHLITKKDKIVDVEIID